LFPFCIGWRIHLLAALILAWAWYVNSPELSYLDLAAGPSGSLTSWGNTVVNGANGIKRTSRKAGIFEMSSDFD